MKPYFGKTEKDAYKEASESMYRKEDIERLNELHNVDTTVILPKYRKVILPKYRKVRK